jgi:hypothetical protein
MILNKHKSICISVSLLLALFCSCSKEKLPEPTTGRFENAPFKWDFIHPATTANAMFIGDRNICQVDKTERTKVNRIAETLVGLSNSRKYADRE